MTDALPRDERALEELFESLLVHVGDPVLLTRPDGAVLRVNPAACRALGRTEEEIRQAGRAEIAVADEALERLLRDRARAGLARGEVRFRRRDGREFPVELTSTLVPVSTGEPVALVVFRDVSERRRLEEALRDSEERFRAAFEALPDAVSLTAAGSGTFLAVNEGAFRVTGWRREEMVGRSSVDLGLWADADRDSFLQRLREDGQLRDFDTHLRRKDGSLIDVLLSARPVQIGEQQFLLTVTRDVTPQRRAERDRDAALSQLRESQKLESVGRLAGGVAHDFNNLLTVILGRGGALEEDLRRGATLDPEDLAEVHAAAARATELTRQLLAFSRRHEAAPTALDPGDVLKRMEKLLRRAIGEDVDLLVGVAREPWLVRCDPSQLEQVLLNLAVNARDALPRGGKLLIETRNVQLDERLAARYPGAAPGRHVLLVVQDNGVGMPPEVRERVFEPFFTTKPEGRGTGLGLATVHGIVIQNGGHIRLESTPGLGTRFELLFPAVEAGSVAAATPAEAPGPRGSETVLVVEDEPRVREVAARILRQAGYRVLDCATGAEALGLLDQEPVALVLSDVMMPGLNGRQLGDRIRERPSAPRLLFMSGHPAEVVHRRGLLDPGTPFVQKPFTAARLLAAVRDALDVG